MPHSRGFTLAPPVPAFLYGGHVTRIYFWKKAIGMSVGVAISAGLVSASSGSHPVGDRPDPVLEWNKIFIDTLIATNTANSSSQRLGAIVHTSMFDAYNGIERRYTPLFVRDSAPHGASRRAATIAAGYTALVGLFPTQ